LRWYKADLHLHSVLSPCGDLAMSPCTVMKIAREKELNLIAITDHNSMANCAAYQEKARLYGITALTGMEVHTSEEIHLITLFDDTASAHEFEKIIYDNLLPLANDPDYFGDQVIIDADGNIMGFEEKALINYSILNLDEIVSLANQYQAFIFPAHVDATSYSILSQLGMIPPNLPIDACGITAKADIKQLLAQYPQLANYALIRNSDAHYPQDIASGYTEFYLDAPTTKELRKACRSELGRRIVTKNIY
jgi:3',5'-nucleoside bisphosphate phosphatase